MKLTDNSFSVPETRFIEIRVNDVNRKPMFVMAENTKVVEGNELKIELNSFDLDNDAIEYSSDNLPTGAELRDNLFVWKPDFDVVSGTEKELSVNFIAYDGDDSEEHKVKITVVNKNRAPELIGSSNNLIVNKDEAVLFEVDVLDEDGDDLIYEWKFGFFDKFVDTNQHQRIFTTTGSKEVKVKVSDGLESVSKVWKVEVV